MCVHQTEALRRSAETPEPCASVSRSGLHGNRPASVQESSIERIVAGQALSAGLGTVRLTDRARTCAQPRGGLDQLKTVLRSLCVALAKRSGMWVGGIVLPLPGGHLRHTWFRLPGQPAPASIRLRHEHCGDSAAATANGVISGDVVSFFAVSRKPDPSGRLTERARWVLMFYCATGWNLSTRRPRFSARKILPLVSAAMP